MILKHCPHCDAELEHEDDEPDVGIVGGWICNECKIVFSEDMSEETLLDG